MENKRKRFQISKNIKFRERMLLIYIIGGIIPFIGTNIYTNHQTSDMTVALSKETQTEEISLISSYIKESMPIIKDVSRALYADQNIRAIVEKVSKSETVDKAELDKDCEELSSIDSYLRYYKQDISDITIYVRNPSISGNKYFSYMGLSVISSQWYNPTCELRGDPYWCFAYDREKKKKCLQLSRSIRDADGKVIGILAIQMQNSRTIKNISKRSTDTMLLYKDRDVVFSNFQVGEEHDFLFERLPEYKKDKKSAIIYDGMDQYLLTYERIFPDGTGTYYTLVSLQNYQEIMGKINTISLKSYAPVLLGLVISVLMIVIFSAIFGDRLQDLRKQMHLVATGRYNEVKPIDGMDEIAEIYQELEQMMSDIQNLMAHVVEEKVQKEKIHTRQKEVEFKMLASQINPHFMYNTLETIRMKARVNNEPEIEELVKMLAKIMRRNIQVKDQMVTLKSEVELIENYLKIQEYRFGDRIQSEVIIDDGIDLQTKTMPLIIQPFVENAYVHGLEAMTDGGRLVIHISQNEKDIVITICDNGVGMNYYRLGKLRRALHRGENLDETHIGINNVNQRLKLQYGEEYGIRIKSEENKGTSVEIPIPRDL